MSELTDFLSRWCRAGIPNRLKIIVDIEKMWEEFKPYADSTCLKEFTSGEENKFQERYWEIFLGTYLLRQGLKLSPPSKTGGPDFRVEHNGRVIWIEATTPSPGGGNNKIANQVPDISSTHGLANKVPADKILLRYTGAMNTKFEKYETYLKKNIIGPSDTFIIAVNYYKYSPLYFTGISTFPAILETVFPMGPKQIHPDGTQSVTFRDKIINANRQPIDTNLFSNTKYSGITAVLFANRNECYRNKLPVMPIILAHNQLATNPLRPSPIKVDCEYRCESSPNGYAICSSH